MAHPLYIHTLQLLKNMLKKYQNLRCYNSLNVRLLNLYFGYLPENTHKDIAYTFSYTGGFEYVRIEMKSSVVQ
jgi:hypothetical protein